MNPRSASSLATRCAKRALTCLFLLTALSWGCNDSDPHHFRVSSTSVIGSATVTYIGSISQTRQARLDESIRLHFAEYERVTGNPVRSVTIRVLIDQLHVQCESGSVASGCYDHDPHRITVTSGTHDEVPWMMHEVHHAEGYLNSHTDPSWVAINQADVALQARIRNSRVPNAP